MWLAIQLRDGASGIKIDYERLSSVEFWFVVILSKASETSGETIRNFEGGS